MAEELQGDLDAKINIIGEQGLRDELVEGGFANAQLMKTILKGEKQYDTYMYEKDFTAFKPDPKVKAIVNGLCNSANIRELAIASIYLG